MVKNLPTGVTGDLGSISESGRPPKGGNGNPLQYYCWDNPMDRGAWQAIIHGVAKSCTQLNEWAQVSIYAPYKPISWINLSLPFSLTDLFLWGWTQTDRLKVQNSVWMVTSSHLVYSVSWCPAQLLESKPLFIFPMSYCSSYMTWPWKKYLSKMGISELGGILFSCIWPFVTQWIGTCQAPPSMGFSRQEYWSGLPFPFPGHLPTLGLNLGLLHCRQTLYYLNHLGSS